MTSDASTHAHPDWCDPFPEPRTIPSGWEPAGLTRNGRKPNSDGKPSAVARNASPVELTERRPDSFPEPRTFPGGWELGDMLALERLRSITH